MELSEEQDMFNAIKVVEMSNSQSNDAINASSKAAISAVQERVINAMSELKKDISFPYHFLGGLSVLGLITLGLYYYDQKYYRQEDSLNWDLKNALKKFKEEMQQERDRRTQIFNQQTQRLRKQMRLQRQIRLRLFKRQMDDLKLALQIERKSRLIEFNNQMGQLAKQSVDERNSRDQLKMELQSIRNELKRQKENRSTFNIEMQSLRNELKSERVDRQSFKAELQANRKQIEEQRRNRISFTNQIQGYTKEARKQRDSFRTELQSLRNEMGVQRNSRVNFVEQMNRFTKEARSEREGWKKDLNFQYQSWKSQNISYKKSIQALLNQSWKQMKSVRQIMNNMKKAQQQRIKKDDVGRYAIIPFISSATWKGVKQVDGGYTWYCKDRPSSTGNSSPTSKDYNTSFSKMNNYLTHLNNLRGQTITVVANIETLGESCKWNEKVLMLDYRCHRYDRRNEAYLQILPFHDTNKSTRSVSINEDKVIIIDCKEARPFRQ